MKDKKILFIRYKKTKGVKDGGEMASEKHYEALCEVVDEDNITTEYIYDETKGRSLTDYIKGVLLFPFGYYFGLTPGRIESLAQQAEKNDVVVIDRSVFGILAKKLKERGYKGKIVTFYHNVEVVYFNAKIGKKPWKSIVINCVDKNDRFSALYSDATITLNSRDEKEIRERYGLKRNFQIPITFDDRLDPFDSQSVEMTRQRPECLFLGSFFPANVEGIVWFVKNVLPKVDINLTIAGKGMSAITPMIGSANVKVESDVADTSPLYAEADAVILPIFSGSGMKVKTCESLMFGKNIFGTDEAFEGYDIDIDKVGRKCNTEEEFISALNDLKTNPRKRFNNGSREAFIGKYTDEAVIPVWKEIIEG